MKTVVSYCFFYLSLCFNTLLSQPSIDFIDIEQEQKEVHQPYFIPKSQKPVNPLNKPASYRINTDYPRETGIDPTSYFKPQAQIGFSEERPVVNTPSPASFYFGVNANSTADQIRKQNEAIIASIENNDLTKQRRDQILDEAASITIPKVKYELGIVQAPGVERFHHALHQLAEMLNGQQPKDFKRAVWLVENAWDHSLTYEEFDDMMNDAVRHIGLMMEQENLPSTNLSKLMAIYRYMADTTTVFVPEKEKTVTTTPMLYDFEDYGGKRNPEKIFVSKLLRTGTGQCMSLPMLYFLLSKEIDAKASIAFAPQHTYIKFQDDLGRWNNIELTGRMFTSDDFIWQSGFIKAEQVKSGIYMHPLSDQEVIAYLVTTLAITYKRRYFITDDFIDVAATVAINHFPQSLTAHGMKAAYYKKLLRYVESQYGKYGKDDKDFERDEQAMHIYTNRVGSVKHIKEKLGYSKMPDWAYEEWLKGVNELANQKQHQVKMRQFEQQLNR